MVDAGQLDPSWPAETVKQRLAELAAQAARSAYCPYSQFAVGAAVMAEDGSVFTGCNVENASYPVTLCAERNACGSLVSSGRTSFVAIAIHAEADHLVTPCGMCRQFMAELAPDALVFCLSRTAQLDTTVKNLLPAAFAAPELRSKAVE